MSKLDSRIDSLMHEVEVARMEVDDASRYGKDHEERCKAKYERAVALLRVYMELKKASRECGCACKCKE